MTNHTDEDANPGRDDSLLGIAFLYENPCLASNPEKNTSSNGVEHAVIKPFDGRSHYFYEDLSLLFDSDGAIDPKTGTHFRVSWFLDLGAFAPERHDEASWAVCITSIGEYDVATPDCSNATR